MKTVEDKFPTLDCLAVVESRDGYTSGTTVESSGVSRASTTSELESANCLSLCLSILAFSETSQLAKAAEASDSRFS